MKEINILNIFKVFLKIGAILLGGGYVIVPIIKRELIEKRNWLSEDELLDFYCVSQCLFGIIAVNMAILTGYKLYKFKGAVTALFAMSLSPVITIILIANIVEKIMVIPFMECIFWAVNISVIILIYLTLKDIWAKSMVDIFCYIWFFAMFIMCCFKINPACVILLSIIFGLGARFIKNKKGEING